MQHFTMDGFRGFRSRFDDIRLVYELLEEIPVTLDTRPVMPPFVLPYYNGVVAEDCGISAFVFLAGGHLTVHTFSFRECYFADVFYPERFDARRLRQMLDDGFPCRETSTSTLTRSEGGLASGPVAPDRDFGPHLFLDIEDYRGPSNLGDLFALLDQLPSRIDMTPIMRPYVVQGRAPSGEPVLSGMTMIAESHIALHVYPESARAYFDIFSCRFFDTPAVLAEIEALLPGRAHRSALVARGRNYTELRAERTTEVMRSKAWLLGVEGR